MRLLLDTLRKLFYAVNNITNCEIQKQRWVGHAGKGTKFYYTAVYAAK